MRGIYKVFLLAFILIFSYTANAASNQMISKFNPPDLQIIDLYKSPSKKSEKVSVPSGNINLPTKINGKKGAFYQIKYDGKDYWISRRQVVRSRGAPVGCTAGIKGASKLISAATPGVASTNCQ